MDSTTAEPVSDTDPTATPPAVVQPGELALLTSDRAYTIVAVGDDQPIQLNVNDVAKWIAPRAPRAEAHKFLAACQATRLNPFLGEIMLIDMGEGRWGTVVTKGGHLKRAQYDPRYDGFRAGILGQAMLPNKTLEPKVQKFEGEFLPRGLVLTGGWAEVYLKGVARPFTATVSMNEYDRGFGAWKRTPCTMIRKVALVHALREAFSLTDVYDLDELSEAVYQQVRSARPGREIQRQDVKVIDPTLPPDLIVQLRDALKAAGATDEDVLTICQRRGVDSIEHLSPLEASQILSRLAEQTSQFPWEAGEVAEAQPTA